MTNAVRGILTAQSGAAAAARQVGRMSTVASLSCRPLQMKARCRCSAPGCCAQRPGRLPEENVRVIQAKSEAIFDDFSHADPLELEADRTAAAVLERPAGGRPVTVSPLRTPPLAQQTSAEHEAVDQALRVGLSSTGQPLPAPLRNDFEARFGHDFGGVRVHADARSSALAESLGARAFTSGRDIVFGAGEYRPGSASGRSLLAHELTHVLQQSEAAGSRTGMPTTAAVQRAVERFGGVNVQVDYGNIIHATVDEFPSRIAGFVTTLTGHAPDSAQTTAIAALTPSAQNWLLYALDLLIDNPLPAGLTAADAMQRLVIRAPTAQAQPLGPDNRAFVREALSVCGWMRAALTGQLQAPRGIGADIVRDTVNPTGPGGSTTIAALDEAAFTRRLTAALRTLVSVFAAALPTAANAGTRSITAFQGLGDIVVAEARHYFSPYADGALGNVFDLQPAWTASASISDVTAPASTQEQRLSYLKNRAEMLGRARTASPAYVDPNIFEQTHFDPQRDADKAVLDAVAVALESETAVASQVDGLIRHTGRQSGQGAAASIGLVTEYNSSRATACQDHWRGIDTLCHELLHALVHPRFMAASARVSFPQVVREGFTEVLGVQLFNDHVLPKAATDGAFKASLEAGVSGAPCPVPAAARVGYEEAGQGAADILHIVGDANFRAAYFLGRPDLAGIPR